MILMLKIFKFALTVTEMQANKCPEGSILCYESNMGRIRHFRPCFLLF